jgi:integrase
MRKLHPKNERIKRGYFIYLREAQRYDESTIDMVAKALSRFEAFTKWADFKRFQADQAVRFKKQLAAQRNERNGQQLSKATLHATLTALRRFFHWLAGQPGYKSRFSYSDSDYFNLAAKDVRVATARRPQRTASVQQIEHILRLMPTDTVQAHRDRALVAFILITGARDGAVASAKLKHVDLSEQLFFQDAREVRTKASKTISTYFFQVSDLAHTILVEWIARLRSELLWGEDDPLFPATQMGHNAERQFVPVGLKREHWSNATPIRKVFREAFERAGLPPCGPHSLRRTLAGEGERSCESPEELKAWSQNLGHEGVLTTLTSYGEVPLGRQAELIRRVGARRSGVDSMHMSR